MLYLLARCVKDSVRYGKSGNFNQSPDKRRHGKNPQKIAKNTAEISRLLKGKALFSAFDYRLVLEQAETGDIVYMDPPYQGVSAAHDHRYAAGVSFGDFAAALAELNRKGVDFIVSYDGACGCRTYGQDLPDSLKCQKIMLNAGRSTQATLLGKAELTSEALYISEGLSQRLLGNAFTPAQQEAV